MLTVKRRLPCGLPPCPPGLATGLSASAEALSRDKGKRRNVTFWQAVRWELPRLLQPFGFPLAGLERVPGSERERTQG